MKKVLSIVMAAVLLVGAVFAFSSCTAPKPELDLEKAKENLEKAGYTVRYQTEDLELGYEEFFTAYDEEYENMLYVIVFTDAGMAKAFYEQTQLSIDASIKCMKAELKLAKATLKAHEDDMTAEEIEDLEEDIKDMEEELEEAKDAVVGRSGTTVWYGTADAVEASKG